MSNLRFSRQFKRDSSWPQPTRRLFCFPYAGGSATAIYRSWPEDLPCTTEVFPVQLPGRGERTGEQPFLNIGDLILQLAKELAPFFDIPFAFYGHSMGALISYELARYLEKSKERRVAHLFVSSYAAPSLPRTQSSVHLLSDKTLLERLNKLQGTPPEVLNYPELMKYVLGVFRTDLMLCENYVFDPGNPLDCPISTFGGLDDPLVSRVDLEQWRHLTKGPCYVDMFEGNHFFLHQVRAFLLDIVSERFFAQRTQVSPENTRIVTEPAG